MSTALWMNIPLMVLAFGLMAGIPLWMVLRRHDWHGKHGSPQRTGLPGAPPGSRPGLHGAPSPVRRLRRSPLHAPADRRANG